MRLSMRIVAVGLVLSAVSMALLGQGPNTGIPAAPGEQPVRRVYPIRAYTSAVKSTNQPQQAVIDWILRDTGYEAWHSNVEATLCADRNELKVTHTPQMQAVVAGMVKRFVNHAGRARSFALRVITLDEPDWRARAYHVLKPVKVQSQGVQAWLIEREHAAVLLAELAKRTDYRMPPEHNVQPSVENGQSYVLSSIRTTSYLRDVPTGTAAGVRPKSEPLEEGMAVEFSPLLSADGTMIDAVLKCHIDQVEQLRGVTIEVPNPLGGNTTARIDVPQVSQYRLQERFRWPVSQVLLVGLGVVPAPHQQAAGAVTIPTMKNLRNLNFGAEGPARSTVLIFIECKAEHADTPVGKGGTAARPRHHNRY